MAPLPVISNVFRVDIPWGQAGGTNTHNTFHIRTVLTDIQEIGEALGDASDGLVANMWLYRPEAGGTSSVEITPLDGETAKQAVPLGATWLGSGSDQAIPAASGLISFRTQQRGPQGRGRLYVGPIQENQQSNGFITSGIVDAVHEAWLDYNAALLTGTGAIQLGVASYTHAAFHQMTSLVTPTKMATQRRRQSRL